MVSDQQLAAKWERETKRLKELATRKHAVPKAMFYWRLSNHRTRSGGWPERNEGNGNKDFEVQNMGRVIQGVGKAE